MEENTLAALIESLDRASPPLERPMPDLARLTARERQVLAPMGRDSTRRPSLIGW